MKIYTVNAYGKRLPVRLGERLGHWILRNLLALGR